MGSFGTYRSWFRHVFILKFIIISLLCSNNVSVAYRTWWRAATRAVPPTKFCLRRPPKFAMSIAGRHATATTPTSIIRPPPVPLLLSLNTHIISNPHITEAAAQSPPRWVPVPRRRWRRRRIFRSVNFSNKRKSNMLTTAAEAEIQGRKRQGQGIQLHGYEFQVARYISTTIERRCSQLTCS